MRLLMLVVALSFVSLIPTQARADCENWQQYQLINAYNCTVGTPDSGGCAQQAVCENPDGTVDTGAPDGYWQQLASAYEGAYGEEPDYMELFQFYVNCAGGVTRDGSGGCGV